MLAIATNNIDSVAETYVRQHIRLIAPKKTSVLFFQGEGDMIQGVPSLLINNKGHLPLPFQKITSMWRTLKYGYAGAVTGQEAQKVLLFLQENNVRTILAEFGTTGCALRQLCKQEDIGLVVNFHGFDATVMPKRYTIRRAYKRLARDAAAFVCGSRFFASKLENLGFPEKKIHVIPCGIEIEEFPVNLEKDPNLVIAIGRLTPKKAPHLTIEAFAKARGAWPKARLELIGDGALRSMCEQRIAQLGLEDCVILHGAKDHSFVKEALSRAGIFVQHSVTAPNGDTESQGISLLEGMASRLPVVVTRHNGFPETVDEGKTGFLVDENDVDGMAEKMLMLLNNPSLQRCMGEKGRIRVASHFSAEVIAGKLRELLVEEAVS